MCLIKIEGEVHCVGAGLVPARTAAGCGPPGGHKGRPYEGEGLAALQIELTRYPFPQAGRGTAASRNPYLGAYSCYSLYNPPGQEDAPP